jgi:hypothetical protein
MGFGIHYTNIEGLSAKFSSVELHIKTHKTAIFALCETQVSDVDFFPITIYSLVSLTIPTFSDKFSDNMLDLT